MPFFVHVRDGWLECWLAVGELEWVVALSTHACFGRRVDLRVGAGALIRSGGTSTPVLEWPPSTLLTEWKCLPSMQELDALFFYSFQTTCEASVLSNLHNEKEIYCVLSLFYKHIKCISIFTKIQEESWTKDKGSLGYYPVHEISHCSSVCFTVYIFLVSFFRFSFSWCATLPGYKRMSEISHSLWETCPVPMKDGAFSKRLSQKSPKIHEEKKESFTLPLLACLHHLDGEEEQTFWCTILYISNTERNKEEALLFWNGILTPETVYEVKTFRYVVFIIIMRVGQNDYSP